MNVPCDDGSSNSRVRSQQPAAGLSVLDVADDLDSPATHYRLSVNGDRIVYISIDDGVYDEDDYRFSPLLLHLLPPLPAGDWNKGNVTKTEERPQPHFAWSKFAHLPGINSIWHPRSVEFHQLNVGEKLMPNVVEASHPELGDIIAKYARFEWEITSYQSETEVYCWLNGHDIGAPFLGHLTEGGRVIGFLLQKLDGQHAGSQDLARCQDAVRKLHSLDILHGDLNCHNFIVSEGQVVLIDFETSFKSHDQGKKAEELRGLRKELLDDLGMAG